MNQALHAFADAPQSANLLRHWYALLDHIPTGVYICDRDGVILRYNARATEIWGWSPQPGDNSVRYGAQRRSFDAAGNLLEPSEWPVATVLRTATPLRGREIIIERRDGVRLFVLVNADPLFDEDGALIGAVNCIQDITAQKRAELREAQDKRTLQAVIETTPDCIKLVAADGTLLQMNAAGCAMIGAAAERLVGASIFDVVAPEYRDHWREHHARVCAGEKLSWEFDLIGAQGRRHMETHAAPLPMPDGSIAHLAVTRDVTSRKEQDQAVREQKQHLQDLLESLPAAVYTTDAEGRITFFNQAAAVMAGRVPRLGEDLWCVTWKLYKPDGTPLPHDECPMAIALKENRAVRGEEAVAERPDGTRVPFIPYPTPIRDADGHLVGAINMLVDVSERKQAEYQQRILLDELNHRVKNNLQMLHSLLRTAQRESNNEEAKSVLEDAAHRIGAIAAAQRVLYSAQSATSFSANDFLEAVCHAGQQAFGGDVKIDVAPSDGELSNEISMPLALILNELLTNAVKHGLNGRRHGAIKVRLARSGDRFDLTVEDDGAGFELRPSSRRSSGLGLVTGLARQLGGTFEVQRPAGARCIVSFPGTRNVLH
jgi:PAS domain S-box-containing protein